MKIRQFEYTKENGDRSNRTALIVAEPRDTVLVYDVSKLTDDQIAYLYCAIQQADDYRDECFREFEATTGIKFNSLWRSFKPGGIDWRD